MQHLMQQTLNRFAIHKKPMLALLGLLCLTLLAIALPAWQAQADDDRGGDNRSTLTGTWRIEFDDFGTTAISYETFTRDGGSVEVNRPGTYNASIGTWKRIGPRKFLATFYKQNFQILENGTGHTVQYDGFVKVRRLFTLSPDGNEISGVATVDVFDAAGNLIVSAPTNAAKGTRLFPEPPDL
jgi:hypothetical protein